MWHFGCNAQTDALTEFTIGLEPDESDQKRRLGRWTSCWMVALAAFLSLFLLPLAARAQTTATLTGTVQDRSGGVIPNARVTLTNEATKEVLQEQTNGAGVYAFPSLVPGTYDIKASAKGFESSEVTDIVLNAGDVRTIPAFALAVGAETETVTVSAAAEMIPVENGQHVDVLSSKESSVPRTLTTLRWKARTLPNC